MSKRTENSVEIVGQGWTQHLPTGTGYDREVLLDHLREAIRLHGNAELVWASGSASIARLTKTSKKECASCHGSARHIVGTSEGRLLCLGCMGQATPKPARPLPRLAPLS